MQSQQVRGGVISPAEAGEPREGALLRFRDKRKREEHWGELPQADAVVTDQCVLWKQTINPSMTRSQLSSCTTAHFEVEFADAQGRMVRCWTGDTPYPCSQVRRGDHVTVWYVPDDDVSRVRVPLLRPRGDTERDSPYQKRRITMRTSDLSRLSGRPPEGVSDEEMWCEPGSFGDLASHSDWGREYWRCVPMMWYSPWVFGTADSPERYTKADLRYFKKTNQDTWGCGLDLFCIFLFSGLWILLIGPFVKSWRFGKSDMMWVWVAVIVLALFVAVFVAMLAEGWNDDRRLMEDARARGRILRRHPHDSDSYPEEVRAHVAEVVRVPLFANGGEVPKVGNRLHANKTAKDIDYGVHYCGAGWMALVVYPGASRPERRWAFADPECYESYLAQGEEPPVRPGDEVVVRVGHEDTKRVIDPWLVYLPHAESAGSKASVGERR